MDLYGAHLPFAEMMALSLYYKDGETPLPIVLNKGSGKIAQAIVKVAREAGVPVMQNVPLARGLMAEAAVGQYIPSELVEPVQEYRQSVMPRSRVVMARMRKAMVSSPRFH